MAVVSSDVLWELTKKSNAFLIKRDNKQFSSDPYNLTNANTRQFAGISNTKAIGVVNKKKADDKIQFKVKRARKYGVKGKTSHQFTVEVKGTYGGRAAAALASLVENRDSKLAGIALRRMKRLNNTEFPKKSYARKK